MITDCLVIGGGLTARRCAEVLARRFDVTLVADGAGASPYIHGVCIPLDPADSVDAFIEDTLKSGKYQNDPALVKTLCEGALSLVDEFPFDKTEEGYSLLRPLGATYPRVAGIQSETGPYVIRKINGGRAFRELKSTRAMRLHVEKGRVLGAEVFHTDTRVWEYIGARSVVLATGGFGGIYPFSTNSSDIGGDGIAMGYLAGAELVDLEFVQFEPTVALSPRALRGRSVITTMLFEGACFRNAKGECFMKSDRVDKDILSKEIAREVLRGGGTEDGGVYFDATGVPVSILEGKYHTYRQRYLNHGMDIAREPMEVAPGAHTTLGGIVIDTACRTGVTGLFAAGEVTGGLHGANRLGGNAGLETLVFGKLAGESVASYLEAAPEAQDIAIDPVDTFYDAEALHDEVKTLIADALGVIREAGKMLHAGGRLSEILAVTEGDTRSFSRMRLYHDALTARLAIGAALLREGSIGAHERSDAKEENTRYRILCDKAHGFRKEMLA